MSRADVPAAEKMIAAAAAIAATARTENAAMTIAVKNTSAVSTFRHQLPVSYKQDLVV